MCLLTLGCLLKNVEDTFEKVIDVKEVRKPDSYGIECTKMCNEDPECESWTQYFGTCYIKTDGSFKLKRKSLNAKWISGISNCTSTEGN